MNCKGNKRTKTYKWNEPTICDISKTSLPEDVTDMPCEICNPGQFHYPVSKDASETTCSACPDGQVMVETDEISTHCDACEAGTYAPKMLNVT